MRAERLLLFLIAVLAFDLCRATEVKNLTAAVDDIRDDEAAVVLMINAERRQRGFVLPLFINRELVLTARRINPGISTSKWNETEFSFSREFRVNDRFPFSRGHSFWHSRNDGATIGDAISDWMKYPDLYSLMVSSQYKEIGAGSIDGSTRIVVLFGLRSQGTFNTLAPPRKIATKSEIIESCGNGVIELPEQCDDNNTLDNDGCNSKCMFEPFYNCRSSTFSPISKCIADDNLWLRRIYGYLAISLFGLGILVTLAVFVISSRSNDSERKEIYDDGSTKISLKKLRRLEKRKAREERAMEKQRRAAIKEKRIVRDDSE